MTSRSMYLTARNTDWVDDIRQKLDDGENINDQDDLGRTALFGAMWGWPDTTVVRFIINEGADLNVPNVHGTTPLHMCAIFNYVAFARILVEAGCRTDIRGPRKRTAREEAIVRTTQYTDHQLADYLDLRSRDNVLDALMTSNDENNYDVPIELINLVADFVTLL